MLVARKVGYLGELVADWEAVRRREGMSIECVMMLLLLQCSAVEISEGEVEEGWMLLGRHGLI